jgi:hypothetical protein
MVDCSLERLAKRIHLPKKYRLSLDPKTLEFVLITPRQRITGRVKSKFSRDVRSRVSGQTEIMNWGRREISGFLTLCEIDEKLSHRMI